MTEAATPPSHTEGPLSISALTDAAAATAAATAAAAAARSILVIRGASCIGGPPEDLLDLLPALDGAYCFHVKTVEETADAAANPSDVSAADIDAAAGDICTLVCAGGPSWGPHTVGGPLERSLGGPLSPPDLQQQQHPHQQQQQQHPHQEQQQQQPHQQQQQQQQQQQKQQEEELSAVAAHTSGVSAAQTSIDTHPSSDKLMHVQLNMHADEALKTLLLKDEEVLKRIGKEGVLGWSSLSDSSISIRRISGGLSNVLYLLEVGEEEQEGGPQGAPQEGGPQEVSQGGPQGGPSSNVPTKKALLRVYGQQDGVSLYSAAGERRLFKALGRQGIAPKCLAEFEVGLSLGFRV